MINIQKTGRPGVIVTVMITIVQVILIDGTECNVIVIEIKVIVIEVLQLNISVTPKFNFIENNQTKNSVF